jgi:hypothetical protein
MVLSSIDIPILGLVIVKRGLNRSGSDAAFFNESIMRDAMSGMRTVVALENERCHQSLEGVFGVQERKGSQPGEDPDRILNRCRDEHDIICHPWKCDIPPTEVKMTNISNSN